MNKNFKVLITVLIIFSALFYFSYKKSLGYTLSEDTSELNFSIEKGQGVSEVAEKLREKNLISSDFFFKLYVRSNGLDTKLKAGDYIISPDMNMTEIVDTFIKGETVSREMDVLLVDGWTTKEMSESLGEKNIFSADDFYSLTSTPVDNWIFDFEKPSFLEALPSGHDLEGYIFPDTYKIYRDARPDDLIEKALDNFEKKIDKNLMDDIEKSGRTLHEIITMASIIEKEVQTDKDKALVSGILYKRMEIGMRLEVDSTINYITGKNDPGALLADLDIDSPYNTYKNYGLPPGPICNPGFSSIRAAVYPEESEYLFYLNRQDNFETIFSRSYDEHLRNKNKYLK